MSKTLLFFGNERLASGVEEDGRLLQALIDDGYDVAQLIVSQAEQRGRRKRKPAVEDIAEKNGIPIMRQWDADQVIKIVKDSGAHFGVLAAFGKIVPESVINTFEHGILNLHPSLLPKYRGSSPIEAAILSGDKTTGISIMQLVKAMDAGPLYGFSEVDNDESLSKQQLYERLLDVGSAMLLELLPDILAGKIDVLHQDESAATFCPRLTRQQSLLDWQNSASQLAREVRALRGWPGSKTTISGKPVTVLSAAAINEQGRPGSSFVTDEKLIGVYCKQGALAISELKPDGKAAMSAEAFLAGNPI